MGRLTNLKPTLTPLDVRIAQPPHKVADVFYHSLEWRKLIGQIIGERGRACEACGSRDGRIYGDHIIELRDGGAPLARGNVQLLCAPCHGMKTHKVRRQRMGGA